jgi:hypothetical protein
MRIWQDARYTDVVDVRDGGGEGEWTALLFVFFSHLLHESLLHKLTLYLSMDSALPRRLSHRTRTHSPTTRNYWKTQPITSPRRRCANFCSDCPTPRASDSHVRTVEYVGYIAWLWIGYRGSSLLCLISTSSHDLPHQQQYVLRAYPRPVLSNITNFLKLRNV